MVDPPRSPPEPIKTPELVKNEKRRASRTLFPLLCLTVALEASGAAAIFPLLAAIQSAHDLPTYSLGLMAGGFYVAALFTQLFGGRLLDSRNARPVLLAGIGFGAAAFLWFGLASDLWQLVAARAFEGLCFGIVIPASLKAAGAGVDPERRGTRIGRITAANSVGLVVGPLAGTLLSSLGGLSLPFIVIAAAMAATLVAILAVPDPARETTGDTGTAAAGTAASAKASPAAALPLVANPPLAAIVALVLLAAGAQLAFGLYDALWSRLLTDRGASSFLIGLSLSLFGIPIILFSSAGGRFAARRGPLLVTAIALVVSSFFMASYGLLTGPIVIVAVSTFEAFVQAVASPGAAAAVAEVYPQERAATGQALFGAAGTSAAGVAGLVAAPLYAGLGPAFVFCSAAGVTIVFVVAAVLVGRRHIHAPPRAAVTAPASRSVQPAPDRGG